MKTFKYTCDICGKVADAVKPENSWENVRHPEGWFDRIDWLSIVNDVCDECMESINDFIKTKQKQNDL